MTCCAEDPDEVRRLLGSLEHKFNGDIFRLPESSRRGLTATTLRRFARLVEARTLNRQRYLWQPFSFEHIPVEIISHLYQRFVKGGHGTVYTPPFLAALLLDHAMPYDRLTGHERVLDPACGSGVFLVGAFRRLINVWRSRNRWNRPDVDTLKKILGQGVFGVEMEAHAIDLTVFSLALAVCDALKPDVIWRDLKLDPLSGTNVVEADFFTLLLDREHGTHTVLDGGFDVVIGNPPFESALTEPGERVNEGAQRNYPERKKLPDKQVAHLFLEQALGMLRPHGCACLIQPSGLLYNRKADPFRTCLLRRHQVDSILDFCSIRNLYAADTKTVAVCALAGPPSENHSIQHWTFRRTFGVHERLCFELDHYDHHCVSQPIAISDPFVWRINLLGGGRLLSVSNRICSMRTLAEFVAEKGWTYGEGFIVGNRKYEAPWLKGKPFLPTAALTDDGIDETKIGTVDQSRFEAPRREDLYTGPLVAIRENQSLPNAFWDKGFLAFRDKIVGMHAPASDVEALCELYGAFCRRRGTYRFCCTLNGSQALVGKATAILKQDIDALPYPDNPNDLTLSYWEETLRDDVPAVHGRLHTTGPELRIAAKQSQRRGSA